jgi:hypothetical protein
MMRLATTSGMICGIRVSSLLEDDDDDDDDGDDDGDDITRSEDDEDIIGGDDIIGTTTRMWNFKLTRAISKSALMPLCRHMLRFVDEL